MRASRHLFLVLSFVTAALGFAGRASADSWTATGSLNVARAGHTATLLGDGRVLVVGGSGADWTLVEGTELYDPATGTWSLTGSLATPRAGYSATLLPDGRVLVAGGITGASPAWGTTGSAELYDPARGTWAPAGSMATARSGHTATLLPDGTVLVAGGFDLDILGSAEIYDPGTDSWRPTGALNVPRYWHTATLLLDGNVLIAGGSDDGDLGSTLASVERYDLATGMWSRVADRSRGSVFHTTTLLPDGRVLLTGGYVLPPRSVGAVELWDPRASTWSVAGDLPSARDSHTATVLVNGDVLVAGGHAWSSRYPRLQIATRGEAALLEAGSATWRPAARLNEPRANHTATLLRDGRVLVVGGNAYDGSAGGASSRRAVLGSAELYGPGGEDEACKNHYILIRPCDRQEPRGLR